MAKKGMVRCQKGCKKGLFKREEADGGGFRRCSCSNGYVQKSTHRLPMQKVKKQPVHISQITKELVFPEPLNPETKASSIFYYWEND